MHFKTNTLQLLSLLFSSATAVPTFPSQVCTLSPDTYTVTGQQIIEGQFVTGDYTVGGGSTLTDSSTYSVGVTITVGASLSIGSIANLGLSTSVATTTTKATSQGANVPCPNGPWMCALAIYPEMLEVSGEQQVPSGLSCPLDPSVFVPHPYTVSFPVEGDSGGVKSRVDVCACQNYAHWADEGAPTVVCESCP